MRLFAGVELQDGVRADCAAATRALQDRLRSGRGTLDIRWVPDDNLHITVVFLGHVDEGRSSQIRAALERPWELETFAFDIHGAGAFPPAGPPRILWLGTRDAHGGLAEVHRETSRRLEPLGFPPERRPYHPHVTIGRVRDIGRDAARRTRAVLADARVASGPNRVEFVTLFQSHLSPSGARYELLLRVPLKGC